MAEKHSVHGKRSGSGRKSGAKTGIRIAAAFVIGILSAGGIAYASTEGEVINYMADFIGGGTYYEKTKIDENGMENPAVTILSTAVPIGETGQSGFPLLLEEGRLYFTGDGGMTDITDEISETEPFSIDITDGDGNTHQFLIQGRAEEGCYGYEEKLFDGDGNYRGSIGSPAARQGDE